MKRKPVIHQQHEITDPVPRKSRVAFKRPLSAQERVLRAIRNHEMLKELDSQPGDDTFDTPIENLSTPHQLMVDPISGEEMTAGEHVMLQQERKQARIDVEAKFIADREKEDREAAKKASRRTAAKKGTDVSTETSEDESAEIED